MVGIPVSFFGMAYFQVVQGFLLLISGIVTEMNFPSIPWKMNGWNLHITSNHLFEKENHLPNLHWVVVSSIFLIFTLFEEDSQFDSYFSNGLKPQNKFTLVFQP